MDLFQSALTFSLMYASYSSCIMWRQKRIINQLMIDPVFGIHNRTSLEIMDIKHRYIIFWDIDDLHSQNANYGYDDVNKRVKAACRCIRQSRDSALIARYFSGDEFVYLCPCNDALGASERVMSAFNDQNLSITLSGCPIRNDDWHETVSYLIQNVKYMKENERKGKSVLYLTMNNLPGIMFCSAKS